MRYPFTFFMYALWLNSLSISLKLLCDLNMDPPPPFLFLHISLSLMHACTHTHALCICVLSAFRSSPERCNNFCTILLCDLITLDAITERCKLLLGISDTLDPCIFFPFNLNAVIFIFAIYRWTWSMLISLSNVVNWPLQASYGRNFEDVARTTLRNKESVYSFCYCFSLLSMLWYLVLSIACTAFADWSSKQSIFWHTVQSFWSCRQVYLNLFGFRVLLLNFSFVVCGYCLHGTKSVDPLFEVFTTKCFPTCMMQHLDLHLVFPSL